MFELEKIPGLAAILYNAVAARGFKSLYKKLAEEIVTEVKSGKVLDIGTGPGCLPIEVSKLNARLEIIGIDLSSKMIDLARKNSEAAKVDRVGYELADAHNLPYPNDSFDFIFSSSSLHHWRYRDQVFREIRRVLKNDGSAYIWDFRKDASKREIKTTIVSSSFYALYLSWALKFHGLRTEEWRALDNRFSVRWNGALACLILKKND